MPVQLSDVASWGERLTRMSVKLIDAKRVVVANVKKIVLFLQMECNPNCNWNENLV